MLCIPIYLLNILSFVVHTNICVNHTQFTFICCVHQYMCFTTCLHMSKTFISSVLKKKKKQAIVIAKPLWSCVKTLMKPISQIVFKMLT